jgi:hypothetical protein
MLHGSVIWENARVQSDEVEEGRVPIKVVVDAGWGWTFLLGYLWGK